MDSSPKPLFQRCEVMTELNSSLLCRAVKPGDSTARANVLGEDELCSGHQPGVPPITRWFFAMWDTTELHWPWAAFLKLRSGEPNTSSLDKEAGALFLSLARDFRPLEH
jgi:hypothetical protein